MWLLLSVAVLFVSLSHAQITQQWVLEVNRENCDLECEGQSCTIIQPLWIRCRSPDKGASWECTSNLRETHNLQLVDTSVIWLEGRCRATFGTKIGPPAGGSLLLSGCELAQGLLNLLISIGEWCIFPTGLRVHPLNVCHEPRPEHEYTPALRVWASPPREERNMILEVLALIGAFAVFMACFAALTSGSKTGQSPLDPLEESSKAPEEPVANRKQPVRAKREKKSQ